MLELGALYSSIALYQYPALFLLAAIEGPIVTVVAGFLASIGQMNMLAALVLVVLGDLLGDFLHYAAGRWGREGFVNKWGHYVGITTERVIQMEGYFQKHPLKTYAFSKFAHGIGGVVLVAAGMVREPLWEFFWYNLVFTVPKSIMLLAVGYFFGASIPAIESYLGIAGEILIGVTVFAVILYAFYRPHTKPDVPRDL